MATFGLAALVCVLYAALFLLLRWTAALQAVMAISVIAVAAVLLVPRRPPAVGRWIAGAALGLTLLLIVAEEVALASLGSGALFRGGDDPFYVQLWGNRALPRIEQVLRQGDTEARRWAADALHPYGRAAVPAWQAGLKDPDAPVRRRCAAELGSFPDPSSEKLLLAAMHDPDPEVQVKAGTGLALTAGAESCRAMARTAGAALRNRRNPRAAPRAGADPAAEVTGATLRDLVARRYETVARGLADPEPDIRLGMLYGLNPNGSGTQVATTRAIDLVRPLLHDPDPVVRAYAVQVLGEVTRSALRAGQAISSGVDPAWIGRAAPGSSAVDADGVLNELAAQLAASRPEAASPALGAIYLVLYDLPPRRQSGKVALPAPVVRPETYARIFDAVWGALAAGCGDFQAENTLGTIYENASCSRLFVGKLKAGAKKMRVRAAYAVCRIGDRSAVPELRAADAGWTATAEDFCPVCQTYHCAFCTAIHHLDRSASVPHPLGRE